MIKLAPKLKKSAILCLLISFIILPLVSLGQEAQETTEKSSEYELQVPLPGGGSVSSLGSYIQMIFSVAMILASLAAVLMIIFGGYKYMTAAGSAKGAEDAKDMIGGALLGLLLLVGTYVILRTINPDLVTFPSFKLKEQPLLSNQKEVAVAEIVAKEESASARLASAEENEDTAISFANQDTSFNENYTTQLAPFYFTQEDSSVSLTTVTPTPTPTKKTGINLSIIESETITKPPKGQGGKITIKVTYNDGSPCHAQTELYKTGNTSPIDYKSTVAGTGKVTYDGLATGRYAYYAYYWIDPDKPKTEDNLVNAWGGKFIEITTSGYTPGPPGPPTPPPFPNYSATIKVDEKIKERGGRVNQDIEFLLSIKRPEPETGTYPPLYTTWDFGDGNKEGPVLYTSDTRKVSHKYTKAGEFKVKVHLEVKPKNIPYDIELKTVVFDSEPLTIRVYDIGSQEKQILYVEPKEILTIDVSVEQYDLSKSPSTKELIAEGTFTYSPDQDGNSTIKILCDAADEVGWNIIDTGTGRKSMKITIGSAGGPVKPVVKIVHNNMHFQSIWKCNNQSKCMSLEINGVPYGEGEPTPTPTPEPGEPGEPGTWQIDMGGPKKSGQVSFKVTGVQQNEPDTSNKYQFVMLAKHTKWTNDHKDPNHFKWNYFILRKYRDGILKQGLCWDGYGRCDEDRRWDELTWNPKKTYNITVSWGNNKVKVSVDGKEGPESRISYSNFAPQHIYVGRGISNRKPVPATYMDLTWSASD